MTRRADAIKEGRLDAERIHGRRPAPTATSSTGARRGSLRRQLRRQSRDHHDLAFTSIPSYGLIFVLLMT